MPGKQIHAVGILTADLPTSLAFYRMLGVDIPAVAADTTVTFIAPDNGVAIGWGTEPAVREYNPARTVGAGGSPVQLEIEYDSPAEVDRTYRAVTAAGHRGQVAPFDAFWGVRFAVVEDPDGIPIGLTAARTTDTR